jgi:hypothetical protein
MVLNPQPLQGGCKIVKHMDLRRIIGEFRESPPHSSHPEHAGIGCDKSTLGISREDMTPGQQTRLVGSHLKAGHRPQVNNLIELWIEDWVRLAFVLPRFDFAPSHQPRAGTDDQSVLFVDNITKRQSNLRFQLLQRLAGVKVARNCTLSHARIAATLLHILWVLTSPPRAQVDQKRKPLQSNRRERL